MSGLSLSSVVKEGEFEFLSTGTHVCVCVKVKVMFKNTHKTTCRTYILSLWHLHTDTHRHPVSQLSDWYHSGKGKDCG